MRFGKFTQCVIGIALVGDVRCKNATLFQDAFLPHPPGVFSDLACAKIIASGFIWPIRIIKNNQIKA